MQQLDPALAALIVAVAGGLLGLIITLLLLYMVIRLGVTHALRSHAEAERRRSSRIG